MTALIGVQLSLEEARAVIYGLRQAAHDQDPEFPRPQVRPWADEMATVADKIELAIEREQVPA